MLLFGLATCYYCPSMAILLLLLLFLLPSTSSQLISVSSHSIRTACCCFSFRCRRVGRLVEAVVRRDCSQPQVSSRLPWPFRPPSPPERQDKTEGKKKNRRGVSEWEICCWLVLVFVNVNECTVCVCCFCCHNHHCHCCYLGFQEFSFEFIHVVDILQTVVSAYRQ